MYALELHGNPSSAEDTLTSNVFSFFKYADRGIFLNALLSELRMPVDDDTLEACDFRFWPRYDEGTIPDLVLVAGQNYILIEAKYYTDFGAETDRKKSQPEREIAGGMAEAESLGLAFFYVAVTADYYFKPAKFAEIEALAGESFRWTNWQRIGTVIRQCLQAGPVDARDAMMATDLLEVLDKKNLRLFGSFDSLSALHADVLPARSPLFFDTAFATFGGRMAGFSATLGSCQPIASVGRQPLFFEARGKVTATGKFVGCAATLDSCAPVPPVSGQPLFFSRRNTN